MALHRSIAFWVGAGVLLAGALVAAGCDGDVAGPEDLREVVFEVGPLFRSADGQRCATVVDSLFLRTTEADGTEQVARRALTPDETVVRIPVDVATGTVGFEAEVRSNNGTRLYAGAASAQVEADGFSVEVPLAAVDAVLKACPDIVPLTLEEAAYRGAFRVFNLGSQPAEWAATFDSPLCGVEPPVPCFRLAPDAGTVASGDSVRVAATALATTLDGALDVRITSPVGVLDLRLAAELLVPEARPDTVTVLEGRTLGVDVLANDTDPGGDALMLVDVGPAEFGDVFQVSDLAFYRADYTPQWGETSEDRFPYVVDAGGRRAEGAVAVRVDPCMTFEARDAVDDPDVPFYTENGVTATTRSMEVTPGDFRFVLARIDTIPGPNADLGLYLENAAIEFDWSRQPVRYVRIDFLNNAEAINVAINDGDRIVAPDLAPPLPIPAGITPRLEDGTFGENSRLVLEADAATPIARLLLGGGDAFNDNDTLLLDDVCFGLAPPDGD